MSYKENQKMDDEILDTVQSMFGCDVHIIDFEKTSTVAQEEQILINGVPLKLDNLSADNSVAIRDAFRKGEMPSIEVLNELLNEAGLLEKSLQLETSMSVKSSTTTKEEVCVSKAGKVLNEKISETKQDYIFKSNTKEILNPIIKTKAPDNLTVTKQNNKLNPLQNCGLEISSSGNVEQKDSCITITSLSEDDKAQTYSTLSNFSMCTCSKSSNDDICGARSLSYDTDQYTSFGNADVTDKTTNNSFTETENIASKDSVEFWIPQLSVQQNYANISEATDALVFENGNLISGRLDDIILHMVPKSIYYPDKDFLKLFLMCSKAFMSPREIIEKCLKVWSAQLKNEVDKSKSTYHIIGVLKECRKVFGNDIDVVEYLKDIENCTKQYTNCSKITEEQIRVFNCESVGNQNVEVDVPKKSITTRGNNLCDNFVENEKFKHKCIMDVCSDPKELAQQLTAIEYHYLFKIRGIHLIDYIKHKYHQSDYENSSYNKEDQYADHLDDIKDYNHWFERLQLSTVTSVLNAFKKKNRVRLINFWIETARECFNIGNFNSMMAILMGLNLPAIARLKKTWSKVQMAKFSILQHQMDEQSNFASYRLTFNAALWRRKMNGKNGNCSVVPYFNLFLDDLHSLLEICLKRLPNQHINFEKCAQLSKLLLEFDELKTFATKCHKCESTVYYFSEYSKNYNEDYVLMQSYMFESPQSPDEKSNYKAIRSKMNSNQQE